MYEDEKSFAKGIYEILVNFMSEGSVKSLENYWLVNSNAIETMRKIDESLYLKLIEKFKEKKNEINANSDSGGTGHANSDPRRKGQTDDERELRARKQKTKEYRKHYSTAGLR
tara:strand:+ start:518 stop:856 length:339 start_codon:yes stop_codon:yes gene_type:complete